MIPFSILDLAPVVEGATPADALRSTLDLARHAERLGFKRYWLAEHHNMVGIASAATAVVIGQVAAATKTIRVGAGGIMLPNHPPLVVAEQFGTLESLFPGRIDLGLGRAPGTDQLTARALRRDEARAERFPEEVRELQRFLGPLQEGQRVQAVPGAGLRVPIWILGSSLFGAQLAALFGLPYAFASHFAPEALMPALELYRARFQPSEQLAEPYAMVGVNVIAAESDAAARRLFAEQGYERTVIRDIAAAAGIDPAMVIRYFGSKDRLFAEVADFDLGLPDVARIDRALVGETLVGHFLALWEDDGANSGLPILLRSAASNEFAAARMQQLFAAQVLPVILSLGSPESAAKRAGLVASQILGLAFTRYVLRLPPVVALDRATILAEVGATVQRYATRD